MVLILVVKRMLRVKSLKTDQVLNFLDSVQLADTEPDAELEED